MSLEHILLSRLEARSVQLAQLKQEIHGLKLLVDEKMTINENLAAEVTRERETARANYEHMERQISGLRGECEQLRREVPLESTREALKNAVAKLQQHKSDIAKLYELADEIGRGTDESIADVMKRQGARIAGLVTKLQEVTTERDRLQDGLRAQTETLSVELSARYAEIAELHKWATGLIENPSFAQNAPERTMHYREIVERINSRPQLDLTATLPAIDWQAICTKREDEIARLNAKVGPLEKLYTTIKKHLDHGIFFSSGAGIYDAVAETAKELSQLTA